MTAGDDKATATTGVVAYFGLTVALPTVSGGLENWPPQRGIRGIQAFLTLDRPLQVKAIMAPQHAGVTFAILTERYFGHQTSSQATLAGGAFTKRLFR